MRQPRRRGALEWRRAASGRPRASGPDRRPRGAVATAEAHDRERARSARTRRDRACETSEAWRSRMATRPGKPARAGRLASTCTRRLSPCTRPRAVDERRSWSRSMRPRNSSFAATTSSAAADGVGARKSATKSAMVTSVSCPTAEITGTGLSAIARATISSLKAHRSSTEPPPRPTITTSTPTTAPIALIPRAMSSAAPSPCTRAGRITSCALP